MAWYSRGAQLVRLICREAHLGSGASFEFSRKVVLSNTLAISSVARNVPALDLPCLRLRSAAGISEIR